MKKFGKVIKGLITVIVLSIVVFVIIVLIRIPESSDIVDSYDEVKLYSVTTSTE